MQSNQETHDYNIKDNIMYGYVCCRVISEKGQPFDVIHEDANRGYEEITGLKNIVGRTLSEVIPGIVESHPKFFEELIQINETGIPVRFEKYLERLNKWLDISVYRPQKGYLAAIFYDITVRKEAEKALKQSEERFRTLFNSHSAIQVLLDPETGKVLDVNQAASEWYGWSVDELKQMYTKDVNTLSPEAIIENLKNVSNGQQNKFTGCHRMANGSIRDVEVFRNKIMIDDKAVIHAVIYDITERKQTEEALRQSEERFRNLFDGHSAIMIVLDPDTGNIVDANQAAADFYGWRVDELKKMNILDINNSSPEAVQKEMETWKMMEQRSMSFRHRRADGSIRDVEIFGKKIKIGARVLVYDIIHDITERRQYEYVNEFRLRLLQIAETYSVEQMLMTTLDEAERLTGSSIGFLFFVDEDQNTLLLQAVSTNTFEHMCKAEGKGKHYPLNKAGVWADAVRARKAVIHNDYPSLTHRKGMPIGHAAVQRELVVPVIREERIVAIMGIGNKLTDYDNQDIEWVEILANQVWDIVAKKIAEEGQKKLQAKLQQSAKMEMIGQLAAGIAHEINNPLNFIMVNEHTMQEDFNDLFELVGDYRQIISKTGTLPAFAEEVEQLREKERELDIDDLLNSIPRTLEKSQNGVERIKNIIHSMRSYSFKNVLEKISSFDVNKAIQEALVITRSEYQSIATVTLSLGELPLLLCDSSQINQVILNLIINSIHAIKSQNRSSPGNLEIKTWATSENVFCSITDDGPGIPEELKERIFEPFFTTKEPGKGTGLGLNISYDIIVKKHQGTISVGSAPGGGTVFTFSVPIKIPVELMERPQQPD
jgi:two-component system NtrC family sensor kinase